MTNKTVNENYQVVWLVRRLFRALAQKASENLGQYQLSVADRAVMEKGAPGWTVAPFLIRPLSYILHTWFEWGQRIHNWFPNK